MTRPYDLKGSAFWWKGCSAAGGDWGNAIRMILDLRWSELTRSWVQYGTCRRKQEKCHDPQEALNSTGGDWAFSDRRWRGELGQVAFRKRLRRKRWRRSRQRQWGERVKGGLVTENVKDTWWNLWKHSSRGEGRSQTWSLRDEWDETGRNKRTESINASRHRAETQEGSGSTHKMSTVDTTKGLLCKDEETVFFQVCWDL